MSDQATTDGGVYREQSSLADDGVKPGKSRRLILPLQLMPIVYTLRAPLRLHNMPRKAQSQWNFGELFEPEAEPAETRKIRSVAEITSAVKSLLNRDFSKVWVSGEITNFRAQASGHCYFSLKDEKAQLSCVLFRGQKVGNRSALDDGQKVLLCGDVTIYEARGQYQLIVSAIELQGVGALQLQFEKLKQKLDAEGLFSSERKRPLPDYPARIGLVTSPTGAAIRDVLHVIERRNPALEIVHAACRVQGETAGAEVAAAIKRLNSYAVAEQPLDLILITRGGGSLEDLWAFNEEVVARAIAGSKLPIISGVGHEIDFTIADFTADFRAATPSAAAEIITEGVFGSRQFLHEARQRMSAATRRGIADRRDDLNALRHRLGMRHPRRMLQENMQRLDDFRADLRSSISSGLGDRRTRVEHLQHRLRAVPLARLLDHQRDRLEQLRRRLSEQIRKRHQELKTRVGELAERLRILSPQNVLDRGYSITRDAQSGQVIKDANKAVRGQRLTTTVAAGEINSEIV